MSAASRQPWRQRFGRWLPQPVVSLYRNSRAAWAESLRRTVIVAPVGRWQPSPERPCALLVVGRTFDQRKPDAMMTCRMGYARAFEQLDIPYLICDWRDVAAIAARLPRAFALVFGADVPEMDGACCAALSRLPTAVWVNPWFEGERGFFVGHGLPPERWLWTPAHREAILRLKPRFGFTATVPSGLGFFAGWPAAGLKVISLPLACDTTLYTPTGLPDPEFANVDLAFVGGYWDSKGGAIDRYLRPFENRLTVYGYNRWPYSGYRGLLAREREPALYGQAKLCPVVNEPTVALLKGQINERVFKVFGSGGAAVVDAVPAYRELFTADELAVPVDAEEFGAYLRGLLVDSAKRVEVAAKGRTAVLARHTYVHRAREVLAGLGVVFPEESNPV